MLLLVAIVAIPLGPGLAHVRERRAALQEVASRGGLVLMSSDPILKKTGVAGWRIPTVPIWRRMCGDEAVYSMTLPFEEFSGNDLDDAQRIFPEAYCRLRIR